jgi:hypothetical protein
LKVNLAAIQAKPTTAHHASGEALYREVAQRGVETLISPSRNVNVWNAPVRFERAGTAGEAWLRRAHGRFMICLNACCADADSLRWLLAQTSADDEGVNYVAVEGRGVLGLIDRSLSRAENAP